MQYPSAISASRALESKLVYENHLVRMLSSTSVPAYEVSEGSKPSVFVTENAPQRTEAYIYRRRLSLSYSLIISYTVTPALYSSSRIPPVLFWSVRFLGETLSLLDQQRATTTAPAAPQHQRQVPITAIAFDVWYRRGSC